MSMKNSGKRRIKGMAVHLYCATPSIKISEERDKENRKEVNSI